jgi:class 3 adenylate cyclase
MLSRKRPTALGQADYYGVVANTAARIMGLTNPGCIWIEGHLPFSTRQKQVFGVRHAIEIDLLGGPKPEKGKIWLEPQGFFQIKGLPKPAPVFEVRCNRRRTECNCCWSHLHRLQVL